MAFDVTRFIELLEASAIPDAVRLLNEQPPRDYAEQLAVSRLIREAAPRLGAMHSLHLAILRTYTCEPLEHYLRVRLFQDGVLAHVQFGSYGGFEADLASQTLADFSPDAAILCIRLTDLSEEACASYYADRERSRQRLQHLKARLLSVWSAFTARFGRKPMLMPLLTVPEAYREPFEWSAPEGLVRAVARLNEELLDEGRAVGWLLAYEAPEGPSDSRMQHLAGQPYAMAYYEELADRLSAYLKRLYQPAKKCVVLDVDNTLWGGVIGEDGLSGIQLGGGYPGNAYQAFQRYLLSLYHKGILLAINSRNNAEDVLQALRGHPDMVLREAHFASIQANWDEKEENLRRIARELNLGLDSLVMVDDNPVECELIRQRLPEVEVLPLPPHPYLYVEAVHRAGFFAKLSLSEEDTLRNSAYRNERKRQQAKSAFDSPEAYYRSLAMHADIRVNDRQDLERVHQLCARTNQFNLTTNRRSPAELEAWLAQPQHHRLYTLRLSDTFGDYGLVAVAHVRLEGATGHVEDFLMSCRVMHRMCETALLHAIVRDVAGRGIGQLLGYYRPTPKNSVVKTFWVEHGFAPDGTRPQGMDAERFLAETSRLTLPSHCVACVELVDAATASPADARPSGRARRAAVAAGTAQ